MVSIEKLSIENHQELEQMIVNEINLVEKGLTVICSNVPINDKTTLDVLCHDNNGQLVIIQLSVQEDDTMLLQGLQSLDYVDKFKSFLKATYNKHKIDDKEKPRLILIAPSFSDAVKRAVESMKGIRVDLYEWEYLKLGDHKEPIVAWKHAEKPKEKEEKALEKKHEPKASKKKEEPKEEAPPPPPPSQSKEPEPKPEQQPKPEPMKVETPKEEKTPPPPPPQTAPPKPLMEKPKEEPRRKLKLF